MHFTSFACNEVSDYKHFWHLPLSLFCVSRLNIVGVANYGVPFVSKLLRRGCLAQGSMFSIPVDVYWRLQHSFIDRYDQQRNRCLAKG
jgi:hypothetical protein